MRSVDFIQFKIHFCLNGLLVFFSPNLDFKNISKRKQRLVSFYMRNRYEFLEPSVDNRYIYTN